ncbi:hypothetical protein F5148DRAFT_1153036 [Russula earlei]|uniref:Uncharacterized protein n=1 Tax=Russula earlei TaxID=71964 RepID=A0ACC0TVJ2_9AGAM|nr:hypothetical protein F5148DRAFT_1153036 [Russula earlei]
MPTASEQGRPVIIITGANNPDDALSVLPHTGADEQGIEHPCAGLTLIMACRSRRRAEAARTQLLELFESDVARLRGATDAAERVADFPRESRRGHSYARPRIGAEHPRVCGRGGAHVPVRVAPRIQPRHRAFLEHLMVTPPASRTFSNSSCSIFVTNPSYDVQHTALMSDDSLGWAWQCNVLGPLHARARPLIAVHCEELEAKLAASPIGPGRVVWMSSHAAHADAYDPDDRQLMDLIRTELSRRLGPSSQTRHFTVHPGVVASSIDAALVGHFMSEIKVVVFYLARWFGPLHHVCLAPLAIISILLSAEGTPVIQRTVQKDDLLPLRLHCYGSQRAQRGRLGAVLCVAPARKRGVALGQFGARDYYQSFITAGGKIQE